MEAIDKKLNNLLVIETPTSVHSSVMKKINYLRYRPVFLIGFGALVLIFLGILWQINAKLVDAEFLDMTSDFFEVFDSHINPALLSMVLTSFFEIISPVLVFSALASLIGAIYAGKKISLYQFSRI